jgi:hypothetical protein
MANRTYPNDYFAWYNDDKRVAILELDTTSTTTGERVTEKYDTFQSEADVTAGLRITYHSKYTTITTASSSLNGEMSDTHGVDTGLQTCLLYYVKARLFEDQGNLQQAQYFRQMFEKEVKRYPSRKSGVRHLAVPRL